MITHFVTPSVFSLLILPAGSKLFRFVKRVNRSKVEKAMPKRRTGPRWNGVKGIMIHRYTIICVVEILKFRKMKSGKKSFKH
jgi:hypothetical protein